MRVTEEWCRLCGSMDGSISADAELKETVAVLFQIDLPDESQICGDCANFVTDANDFKTRARSLIPMFETLESNEEQSIDDLNRLRLKFGLIGEFIELTEENPEEGTEPLVITVVDAEDPEDEEIFDPEDFEEDYLEMDDDPPPKPREKQGKTENEKLYEFKCHICHQEFLKMQKLSIHCRQEHRVLPQVLCFCGTLLSSWKRLMAHKAKHIKNDNEHTCDTCKISYKTKTGLEKHRQVKHGPAAEKFICATCGKEFKERQILKNHEKVHLPDELKLKHPCKHCGKKFVNNHCLKIHIARVHEKVALHTCELCGKGCITKSDLRWHMDKHVDARNFECEICSLKFKSQNSLRIHRRRHFNQDTILNCPTCGKEFHSSAALSNHKLVHSDVKRYKCFCGNEYKRLESYKCHLSVHTGQRPFSCQWCSRTFVNSANCRKHKLKDHPVEVAEYEAIHGKKGVSINRARSVKISVPGGESVEFSYQAETSQTPTDHQQTEAIGS